MIAVRGLRGIVLMKRVMKIGLPVSSVLLEMFLTSWPKYHDTGRVNYWTCRNFAQKTQIEVVHGFYQKLALMCWIPEMNFVSEPLFIVLNPQNKEHDLQVATLLGDHESEDGVPALLNTLIAPLEGLMQGKSDGHYVLSFLTQWENQLKP